MPLKILFFQEQDIPAFAALDAAAMGHLALARAMSHSMPSDATPRQQMIEEWTREGFAKRGETDTHFLKVVDTSRPAKHGASDEGEIISAAMWAFHKVEEKTEKPDMASVADNDAQENKKEGPSDTGVGTEMRKQWDLLKRDYFSNQPFASMIANSTCLTSLPQLTCHLAKDLKVLVTHPNHQRHGAGSMLVKWGTDEADKRGIISVLVATQMGLGCYLKNGFEVVREDKMDLRPFGVDEVEIRRGMIRRSKPLA